MDTSRWSISSVPSSVPGSWRTCWLKWGHASALFAIFGLDKEVYSQYEALLSPLGFEWNKDNGLYLIAWTEALENLLTQKISVAFDVFTRKPYKPALRDRFNSIQYWYWEHWKFFRSEVKTSIIQGIFVLSLFETNPDVRRVFCPPKELYEDKPCASDPTGRVLPWRHTNWKRATPSQRESQVLASHSNSFSRQGRLPVTTRVVCIGRLRC